MQLAQHTLFSLDNHIQNFQFLEVYRQIYILLLSWLVSDHISEDIHPQMKILIFILGGISSDIHSEIKLYRTAGSFPTIYRTIYLLK